MPQSIAPMCEPRHEGEILQFSLLHPAAPWPWVKVCLWCMEIWVIGCLCELVRYLEVMTNFFNICEDNQNNTLGLIDIENWDIIAQTNSKYDVSRDYFWKFVTSGPSEPAEQADRLQELDTLLNIIIMVHLEGGIILVSLGFKIWRFQRGFSTFSMISPSSLRKKRIWTVE